MSVDLEPRAAVRVVARAVVRRTCPAFPGWFNRRLERLVDRQRRTGSVHESDLWGLDRLLPPRPVIVDVGGHHGQSVVSLKALRPGATIVSFEPNPVAFAHLCRTAGHFGDVTVHPVGLGQSAGSSELSYPVVRGIAFEQLASVRPLPVPELVEQLHADGFRWARPADVRWTTVRIELGELDHFDLRPDLVKIDVEGFERDVLEGARATLRRRPVLVIERGARPDVRRFLEPRGYRAVEWSGDDFAPATGAALNTYFLPVGPSAAGC